MNPLLIRLYEMPSLNMPFVSGIVVFRIALLHYCAKVSYALRLALRRPTKF